VDNTSHLLQISHEDWQRILKTNAEYQLKINASLGIIVIDGEVQ
jgi:hypothetical protein